MEKLTFLLCKYKARGLLDIQSRASKTKVKLFRKDWIMTTSYKMLTRYMEEGKEKKAKKYWKDQNFEIFSKKHAK